MVHPAAFSVDAWRDERASEAWLDLLGEAEWAGRLPRGTRARVEDCAAFWIASGCPDGHADARRVRALQCGSPWCPYCQGRAAARDRADPLKGSVAVLSEALGHGHADGLSWAELELTLPVGLRDRLDYEDTTRLRRAGARLIAAFWDWKGWGVPAPHITAHLTSSSRPWTRAFHLHCIIPGAGRFAAPRARAVPDDVPIRGLERGQAFVTLPRDAVEYRRVPDARGKKPGALHLSKQDLAWLREAWGREIRATFGDDVPLESMESRLDDGTTLYYEGAVIHWQWASWGRPEGESKIRHWCNYNTRSPLKDANEAIHSLAGDQVLVHGLGDDLVPVPRRDVMRGLKWRVETPPFWRMSAWYAWLADSCRGDTFDELGLPRDAVAAYLEARAQEAACCPTCGAEVAELHTSLSSDEARHYLETGELPAPVVPPPHTEHEAHA